MPPCPFTRYLQAGFTLIEVLVVVAVLGLSLSLVVTHGPMRSQSLEMRATVNAVAQGVRLARSKAIATNRQARFVVDPNTHSIRIDDGIPKILPRSTSIAMVAMSHETVGERLAAILFYGDGSGTGGQIELADGQRRAKIGIDRLTGRVTVVWVA